MEEEVGNEGEEVFGKDDTFEGERKEMFGNVFE